MVFFNDILSLGLAAITVLPLSAALPIKHTKRIAQTISESTADWEKACIAAGGADKCNPLSQTAFTSLLAAGGNCDQQNAADAMIGLAKTLNNDSEMIRLTQLFVQQPRNAPDSLQVPYCQKAPKNAELDGLFHCQFAGSNFSKFSGDQTGNVPLGLQAVNPAGSCPAKTDGPVPDGVQLNTLVQNPGVGSTSTGTGTGSGSSTNGTATGTDDTDSNAGNCGVASGAQTGATGVQTSATGVQTGATGVQTGATGVQTGATGVQTGTTAASGGATATAGSAAGTSTSTSSSSSNFVLQNGQDAIALNTQFASLTSSSSCTDGDEACVGGGFAQCVGGAFVVSQCSGGTQCFALPLVNKAGTSLACTTEADKDARIAATGAQFS